MWLLPPVTATDGEFLVVTDNMQNYNYGIYKLKVIAQVIVLPKTLNIQTLFSISQTIRLHNTFEGRDKIQTDQIA